MTNDRSSPSLVPESSHSSATAASKFDPQCHDHDPDCPFCMIARTYHPISPLVASPHTERGTAPAPVSESEPEPEQEAPHTLAALAPDKLDPPSFVLFSSDHVIAFLDIMPLTRGHVLVAPRKHRVKVGDLSADEMGEIGRVLPLLARSVLRAVMPDIPHHQADYNIVQNNGPGAAQVVPHVHFHIVPRPPFGYVPPSLQSQSQQQQQPQPTRKYPPNPQPVGHKRTAILYGRGLRQDLDYDDAAELIETMRQCVREDWEATFTFAEKKQMADLTRTHTHTNTNTSNPGPKPQARGGGGGGDRNGAWKV